MILQEVNDILLTIDPKVIYGKVTESDVPKGQLWNYIVFNRTKKSCPTNKTGYGDHFSVHLVRENFIPEGLDEVLIEKVTGIAGVRLVGEGQFNYVEKPNTGTVVEMFSVDFVKAKKV